MRAIRLDQDTRAVLQAGMPAIGSGFTTGGSTMAQCMIDPTGKTPAQIHQWWDGLSRWQQDQLITDFPAQVGALDGVPADDRDKANRLALHQQKQAVVDLLAAGHGDQYELREQLQRITKVEQTLQRLGDRGYLLMVDTEAYDGHGKVAIAVGNPDTARHTGVWVPGLSTTMYGSMDGNIDRVMRINAAADRLTDGRSGDVSTVYWLGYDAPDLDNTSVLGNSRSESGRDPYLGFMNGLRATHEGDPTHLVAMGHSYGSTVIGEAAATGNLPADDIVVAGSPGMHVDSADRLLDDPRHVWAGASDSDPVADTPMISTSDRIALGLTNPSLGLTAWGLESAADASHGAAPTTDGFGANTWKADTDGHTGYWEPASDSLNNQARVLAGRYDRVTLENGEAPENIP
ncbi:hypothetical protein J5X75_28720 [Actinoplanes sp. NEAU-H7]|uniref:DUF1023 domain-containing protein n=2 Tax=Actinoplanes flavus TaxID=2820290 RepID=A0ABS3USD8_9ACTN|nr:hypothetical protein [Actinoplanes flavus]